MREVSANSHIATVVGGATTDDVAAAADRLDLAAAIGTVGAAGMIGLTLGGGYGPFCGRFGLAADNLISAEVVLVDGQIVYASQDSDPDLLWAIRGGGGNFGVVTSIDMALHPLPEALVGSSTSPFEYAEAVLGAMETW